ncbi:MAG: TetR/AcrR family transcriptional regulator [Actinomycetota bacterium]
MAKKANYSKERRQEILQAAAQVIAERGLCETRIADVAKQAGASAALVMYYFESKDRLLTEALTFSEDRFYLEAFNRLTTLPSASDQLGHLIESSIPPEADDWPLWIELWSRGLRDPEAAKKRSALDRRWRWTIADIVRSGQRTGEFGDVDADDFALRLASLIDGLALQVVLEDEEVTGERMHRVCIDFVRRELDVGARKGRGGVTSRA